MKRFSLVFLFICELVFGQSNLKISAELLPVFDEKSISGKVYFNFDANKSIDSVYLDAKNMTFANVTLNGKKINYQYQNNQLIIKQKFKKKNQLVFDFSAQPKQSLYFFNFFDQKQIWTQGQGKETSYWLPSLDDVTQKILFSLKIHYPQAYQVVSNGLLISSTVNENKKIWHYQMNAPMSSYLVMLAIGDFIKFEESTTSKTPLEFYLTPKEASKYNSTYKHSKTMFDFLETKIGVPYPWQIYRQIPVYDFLYAGMENTTATLFSQEFVVDDLGYLDVTYHNVNAHELAHHWFGNLVTAKTKKDHWIQEGFATYYALQAERYLFGEDFYLEKIYELANNILAVSKDDELRLYAENQSAMTYYYKGAWMLICLENLLGTKKFDEVVKTFLQTYQFSSATTDEFFTIATQIAKEDLSEFKLLWLYQNGFPKEQVLNVLKQFSKFKDWMSVLSLYNLPYAEKKSTLENLWNVADEWTQVEILKQIQGIKNDFETDYLAWMHKAIISKNTKTIQMALMLTKTIPDEHKNLYETLLNNHAYITTELALQGLWQSFAEERTSFLSKTKDLIGLSDYNLRIKWLSLALMTADIPSSDKLTYYDELLAYSTAKFPSNIRRNALESLLFLDKNDTNVFESLANGIVHHKWQFAKYCRDEIKKQLASKNKKEFYTKLVSQLEEANQKVLQKMLDDLPN